MRGDAGRCGEMARLGHAERRQGEVEAVAALPLKTLAERLAVLLLVLLRHELILRARVAADYLDDAHLALGVLEPALGALGVQLLRLRGGPWKVGGGSWKVMEGHGGPWKVVEGHGRSWKVMEGGRGPWRAIEGHRRWMGAMEGR